MGNSIHICGICNQTKEDGIFLYQLYICEECEKKIISTSPKDENYQYYVEKIRAINQSSYTI
ncbi:Inhibitor of sigma-G Gin [Gracilibacillus orientalis]|uniref:Inhibitor of sigma-G Gin n=1 Tax=Gracilibacillus orientalis TaxID=334253 RepID=A0A1I4RGB6_9BACI|nr:sigma factor G inhibitor Gin [Gracilibacillus orientalis]SFM51304.1 Inhibitor of sigma-G Gin [Gracilibacillus orientalis]